MEEINEKIRKANRRELAAAVWPDSNIQTRRVLVGRMVKNGVKRLTPEQFERLKNFLNETDNHKDRL